MNMLIQLQVNEVEEDFWNS